MTKKVRSKANPRSLVFTIGFSAGVVGLAMAKGPKLTHNAKPNAESFLIDTGFGEASIWGVAQDLCAKAFSLPPATPVIGDSEKSPAAGR